MRLPARAFLWMATAMVAVVPPAAAQYGAGARRASVVGTPAVGTSRAQPTLAALVIRRGGDLQLSERQLAVIDSIRMVQDSADRPWWQRLDSLRNGPRPVNPRDLSQEQRELQAARRTAVADAVAAMQRTDAQAHQAVMQALDATQRRKASVLEDEVRNARRDADERRKRQESERTRRDMSPRRED